MGEGEGDSSLEASSLREVDWALNNSVGYGCCWGGYARMLENKIEIIVYAGLSASATALASVAAAYWRCRRSLLSSVSRYVPVVLVAMAVAVLVSSCVPVLQSSLLSLSFS